MRVYSIEGLNIGMWCWWVPKLPLMVKMRRALKEGIEEDPDFILVFSFHNNELKKI